MFKRKSLSTFLIAIAFSMEVFAHDKISADLSLTGARIIDVTNGRTLQGKTVLVRGDSILAVVDQKGLNRYAPKRTVNLRGKYLMPGLWDTHVHFGGGAELIEENKRLLPLYLAHGITAVRDCAGDLSETVLTWRGQIASGQMQGPTIFTSGAKLEGYKPLWKGTIEVGTPEEVSAALDKLQGQQVDFVKITENTMTPAIYLESLKQVKARGMASSAHIPVQLTLDQVFAAGLSSIEHQSYLLRTATPEEAALTEAVAQGKITGKEAMKRSLASYDEATARAAFRRMAAAGTAIVPTLYGSYVTAYLDQNDHSHDAYLQYIGKGLRATYDWRVQRAAQDDAEAIKTRHALFEKSASLLPLLAQEGVSIIAGTDAGFLNSFDYPGIALHDEIALYVKYGLTPAQALQSAIQAGPRLLGKTDRYGSVSDNKVADLLVLNTNPLRNIQATRDIYLVMSRGKIFDKASLEKMLRDTKNWVANPQ